MHDGTYPDSRRATSCSTFVPRRTAAGHKGIWALVLQEQIKNHWDAGRISRLQLFIWFTSSPEFQSPLLPFSSPYRRGWLEMRCQDSFLGYITCHLLRLPAIRIKRPLRFNPCLYSLVLVTTGSTNTDFSSFIFSLPKMPVWEAVWEPIFSPNTHLHPWLHPLPYRYHKDASPGQLLIPYLDVPWASQPNMSPTSFRLLNFPPPPTTTSLHASVQPRTWESS